MEQPPFWLMIANIFIQPHPYQFTGAGSYAGMVLWVNDPMATHADESRQLWVYERKGK